MAVSATEQEAAGARERSLSAEGTGAGREARREGRETCDGGAGVPAGVLPDLPLGGEARRADGGRRPSGSCLWRVCGETARRSPPTSGTRRVSHQIGHR